MYVRFKILLLKTYNKKKTLQNSPQSIFSDFNFMYVKVAHFIDTGQHNLVWDMGKSQVLYLFEDNQN